eukprot:10738001-Alexandrium_andersonii.AAC.1
MIGAHRALPGRCGRLPSHVGDEARAGPCLAAGCQLLRGALPGHCQRIRVRLGLDPARDGDLGGHGDVRVVGLRGAV